MAQQHQPLDQSIYSYGSPSYAAPSGSGSFSGGQTAHHATEEQHRSPSERGSESEDAASPPKKKRKRQALSCTECKRRKIKCDRVQPCTPCTRRGEPAKCRWHIVEPTDKYVLRTEYDQLKARIQVLEDMVQRLTQQTGGSQTILPSIASPLATSPSQSYQQQGYFQHSAPPSVSQPQQQSQQRYSSRETSSPQLSRATSSLMHPHPLNTSTALGSPDYSVHYVSPSSPQAGQRRTASAAPIMNLPSRQSSSLVPASTGYGQSSSLYSSSVSTPGPFHSTQMESPKNGDAQILMTLGEYLRHDAGPAMERTHTERHISEAHTINNSNSNNRIDTTLAEAHSRAMFREISNSHHSITNSLTLRQLSTKKGSDRR